MSERWKVQLLHGGIWGLFMIVFTTLFDEQPVMDQLRSPKFLIKVAVHMSVGIFLMGYIFWKGRNPENNNWPTFFGKKRKG